MELAADLIQKKMSPCVVCSLKRHITLHKDGFLDVFVTAAILKQSPNAPVPHFDNNGKTSLLTPEPSLLDETK
jgi:hypothetical protein